MVKTHVLFKTDTLSNWEQVETSFEGLPGELFVFSDYEDSGRINHLGRKIYIPNIKIGLKNKKIVDLPFIGNQEINNNQIEALFNTNKNTTAALDSLILGYAILE